MPHSRRTRGFTLVETALGMIIIIAFLGLVLVPLSSFMQNSRLDENQRTLELIRERLTEFLVQNGRLPCPAQPDAVSGPNLGVEWVKPDPPSPASPIRIVCEGTGDAYPGTNAAVTGVIPWVTLRVPEDDVWGHRFTYSVDRSWAEIDPSCNPIGTPTQRGCVRNAGTWVPLSLSLRLTPGPAGLQISQTSLAAVVVSHGPNGLGAYNPDGTMSPAPPATADESANRLLMTGPATVNPVRDFRVRPGSSGSGNCDDNGAGPLCTFDDQWISLPQSVLAVKMLQAGHLR